MISGEADDGEDKATTVTVVNTSGGGIDIFWVNDEGEQIRQYENIAHGTSTTLVNGYTISVRWTDCACLWAQECRSRYTHTSDIGG